MSSQWLNSKPPNSDQTPIVTSILRDFSAEALGELRTWLEQNPPAVTIQSIVGFSQFTAQTSVGTNAFSGTLLASGSTSGAGPTIDALPAGKYLLLAGYVGVGDSVNIAQSWAINGPAGTLFTVYGALTSGSSHSGIALASFTAASNPITSVYAASNGAGSSRTWSFANMTIAALRYANA